MTKTSHYIFIGIMSLIIISTFIILINIGQSYYNTSLEERFYHEEHQTLKPSGDIGHGLGIIGSFFMLIGVSTYMIRKRVRAFARWGLLKHWLEFHIFLCTLGPILVLFHTAFKFGGIVSISFWSMVAVFLSGIIGRYIYIQIPRTIEGKELSLSEIKGMKTDISTMLKNDYKLDDESCAVITESTKSRIEVISSNTFIRFAKKYFEDRRNLSKIKTVLKKGELGREESKKIIKFVKNEISLNRKIDRLNTMQNLFKYWHVAHLPFAIIMLVIMIVHVGITLAFGYKWIF